MKDKVIVFLAIVIFALILVTMFFYSKNENCERQTIGSVVEIGDVCSQVEGDTE